MLKHIVAAALALAAFSGTLASAQPAAPPVAQGDRMQLLHALNMPPDARGRVMNACDERVAPQYFNINLGGTVGAAVLVLVTGGPNQVTCYGDVPGVFFLMKRDGGAFHQIFTGQGFFVILPTTHLGVHDVSIGGPGFSFPLYTWNGHAYTASSRTISDATLATGQQYPN
ncbi:MAG: hypothetical protein ABUL73_01325 [Alphaproteobacteria bacterium]